MQFSAFICLDPHISQVVIDDVVELTTTQKILLFLVSFGTIFFTD